MEKCLGACRTHGLTAQAPNKTGAPAKILVVFMGEEGKSTTINAK